MKRLRKKYPRIDSDILPLIERLERGETPGDRIPGVKYAICKERLPNTSASKGQSGGFRVIYYLRTAEYTFLITIYSKNEQVDFPLGEIERIVLDLPDLPEDDASPE